MAGAGGTAGDHNGTASSPANAFATFASCAISASGLMEFTFGVAASGINITAVESLSVAVVDRPSGDTHEDLQTFEAAQFPALAAPSCLPD